MSAAEQIAHRAALLALSEYPLARAYLWIPPAEDERAARLMGGSVLRVVLKCSERLRAATVAAPPVPKIVRSRPTKARVAAFIEAYHELLVLGISSGKFRKLVELHGISNVWNAELLLRRHGVWAGKRGVR